MVGNSGVREEVGFTRRRNVAKTFELADWLLQKWEVLAVFGRSEAALCVDSWRTALAGHPGMRGELTAGRGGDVPGEEAGFSSFRERGFRTMQQAMEQMGAMAEARSPAKL